MGEGMALCALMCTLVCALCCAHTLRMRRAIRAARRQIRMKEELLARVSHELRTPMNVIAELSELTAEQPGLPEKAAQNLRLLHTTAHYTVGLIGEILDMNRIERGRLVIRAEPFSLSALTDEVGTMMALQAEQAGVTLRVVREIAHPWVSGDAMRLRQVLVNLLSNAVKFTPPGGSVRLDVREEDGARYAFSVTDTGRGVAPEDCERIFGAFEQAGSGESRAMGTGLGLPISRTIVEAMGGALTMESEMGKGSRFFFTLPLPREAQRRRQHAAADIAGMRILLAEDNALSAGILRELLEMRGAQADTAANGALAVARMAEGMRYDAVLMDVRMPEMNGLEATRAIRAMDGEAAGVRIIAMSAGAFREEMERAMEAGADGYLVKPVEMAALCRALKG